MFTEKLAGTNRGLCGDKWGGDRGHFEWLRVESAWLRANGEWRGYWCLLLEQQQTGGAAVGFQPTLAQMASNPGGKLRMLCVGPRTRHSKITSTASKRTELKNMTEHGVAELGFEPGALGPVH